MMNYKGQEGQLINNIRYFSKIIQVKNTSEFSLSLNFIKYDFDFMNDM